VSGPAAPGRVGDSSLEEQPEREESRPFTFAD
jgi:hypothetical protein